MFQGSTDELRAGLQLLEATIEPRKVDYIQFNDLLDAYDKGDIMKYYPEYSGKTLDETQTKDLNLLQKFLGIMYGSNRGSLIVHFDDVVTVKEVKNEEVPKGK